MTPTNEFSRRLAIDPWPDDAIRVDVSAEPPERQALAERFGLLAVRSLCGRGRLERRSEPGELVLRGWLEADVVQACVISLEPVPARLRQRVERRYRPIEAGAVAAHLQPHGMEELADDEEVVETVIGGVIDVGEAFAEELGLALDPYPRATGARSRRRRSRSPCECWLGAWRGHAVRRVAAATGEARAVTPPASNEVWNHGRTKEEGFEIQARHAPVAPSLAGRQPGRVLELWRAQASASRLSGVRLLQWP